jgi:hypothetical protein
MRLPCVQVRARWCVRVAWGAENVRVCGESAVMSGPMAVLDRFPRYRFTAPNIAEIAENKKRTN